jgi:MFS family permease
MSKDIRDYQATFIVALVANAIFFFSFQTLFPVFPRFIAEVVVRQPTDSVGSEVGLASTVLALVAVLTRIPAGQMADYFGRRRFMLLGAVCFTAAPLIYVASRSMPLLLLGRVVHGLGLGTFTTAFQALVTDLVPAHRRGEALGLAGASTSVAFISAPLAGDWLAANWGYTPLLNISAAIAAVSVFAVLLCMALPRSRSVPAPATANATRREQIGLSSLKLALAQKGILAGVLTMAALGIPFGMFIIFLPLLAEEQQVAGVGIVFSAYAGIVLLVQPLAGRLSDRVGRSGVILPGLVVTSLATVVLYLDGSLLSFILAGIIFGLGGGLTRGGVDAMVQDSVPATLRGTAAAVQYASFDFWIGIGSYPLGLLANAIDYATTFAVSGIMCLAGGGALAILLRRAVRPAPVGGSPGMPPRSG